MSEKVEWFIFDGIRTLFSASSRVLGSGLLQQDGNNSDNPPPITMSEPHNPMGMNDAIKCVNTNRYGATACPINVQQKQAANPVTLRKEMIRKNILCHFLSLFVCFNSFHAINRFRHSLNMNQRVSLKHTYLDSLN